MRAAVPFLLGLAACSAMPNPPAPRQPAPLPSGPAGPAAPAEPVAQDPPAPAPARKPDPPAPASRDAGLPIARVAGGVIDVSELLGLWLHQDSLQVLETLDHLVLGRLVLAEAGRLGVEVDPAKSENAYKEAVEAIEKTLLAKRPGVTLDRYVDEALGLDPVVYREFLRNESLRGLLAERVVRAWVLGNDHAELRVIVVRSEEESRQVADSLKAGQSFEEVARKLSADPSAKDGGRVPAVVRGDTPISRLAFATEIGQVGGPQYEKGSWLFVQVEAKPEAVQGGWKDVAEAVEKSLAERPVADLEVSQWKPVMVARYGVDVSPLLEMLGQKGK